MSDNTPGLATLEIEEQTQELEGPQPGPVDPNAEWRAENDGYLCLEGYEQRLQILINARLFASGIDPLSSDLWGRFMKHFFPNYLTKRTGVSMSLMGNARAEIIYSARSQERSNLCLFFLDKEGTDSEGRPKYRICPGDDLIDIVEAAKSQVETRRMQTRIHRMRA